MWIVVYKEANWLNVMTQYIGPFSNHEDAYEASCNLPSPGIGGTKFTQELALPSYAMQMIDSCNVIAKDF